MQMVPPNQARANNYVSLKVMAHDSIKELTIAGMRTITMVRLALNPLTVLTGDNGSGKSTVVEACEILRRAAEPNFLEHFLRIHGGLDALQSSDSAFVQLGLTIEGSGDPLSYTFRIEDMAGLAITYERLDLLTNQGAISILSRRGRSGTVLEDSSKQNLDIRSIPGAKLLLTGFGLRVPHPAISRMIRALQQIEVHLPFATMPAWMGRVIGPKTPSMRVSPKSSQGDSLDPLGFNLANVYKALREDSKSWNTTLDYVRVGLGSDIKDVTTRSTDRGLEIFFTYEDFDKLVPAESLSDGTLGYLAFVALFRLAPSRSLIAFDEPENQLHPMMMSRVTQLFEQMSKHSTILVATHSDRLLDSLTDPARSVVLCALGPRRTTNLLRPDAQLLAMWNDDYRGLGDLRSDGKDGFVMTRPAGDGQKP
jgi:predicted ATPase